MLLLAATTDKIQITTSAATNVDVHASYVDLNGTTVTPDKQNTAITTATTTDVVASPAASTKRNVKSMAVRNKSSSTSNDVTVIFDQNGTDFELIKVTLGPGEELCYFDDIGFVVIDANGFQKMATGGDSRIITKLLTADVNNSTTTAAIVSGLSATLGIGTWAIKYLVRYQSGTSTTGVKFSVNHTGTVVHFQFNWHGVDNLAANASAAADQDALAAGGQVYFAFAARAKSTAAGWGPTVSVDTINADMLAVFDGLLEVSVAGTLEFYHASETANQTTVKAGSILIATKCVN
jgi:hypothetical protein